MQRGARTSRYMGGLFHSTWFQFPFCSFPHFSIAGQPSLDTDLPRSPDGFSGG